MGAKNEGNRVVMREHKTFYFNFDLLKMLRHEIGFIRKGNQSLAEHNKLIIIAPTWNAKFELSDGSYSVSDIKDYVEYFIKNAKH